MGKRGADYQLMQVHRSAAAVRGCAISDLSTSWGKMGPNVVMVSSGATIMTITYDLLGLIDSSPG